MKKKELLNRIKELELNIEGFKGDICHYTDRIEYLERYIDLNNWVTTTT